MVKSKDIGFFKKLLLILLTKFQEVLITNDADHDFYYKITKLHFKLYFKRDLVEEALQDSPEFRSAQHRHLCIYLKHHKGNLSKFGKKCVKNAFRDNLLLQSEL